MKITFSVSLLTLCCILVSPIAGYGQSYIIPADIDSINAASNLGQDGRNQNMLVDDDNNIYYLNRSLAQDFDITKIDPNGEIIFQKLFLPERPVYEPNILALAQVTDSTFALVFQNGFLEYSSDSVFLVLFNKRGDLLRPPVYLDSIGQDLNEHVRSVNLIVNDQTFEIVKLRVDFILPTADSTRYRFDRITFQKDGQFMDKTVSRSAWSRSELFLPTTDGRKIFCVKSGDAYYFAYGAQRCYLLKSDLAGNFIKSTRLTNDISEWGFGSISEDRLYVTGSVYSYTLTDTLKGISWVLNDQLDIVRSDVSKSMPYQYISEGINEFIYINFNGGKSVRVELNVLPQAQSRKIEAARSLYGQVNGIEMFNVIGARKAVGYSNAKGNVAYLLYNMPVESRMQYYLVRIDALGNIYGTSIKGKVYLENDLDCHIDSGERVLRGFTVYATSPTHEAFASTDRDGNYEIRTDTGTITISVRPQINYPYIDQSTCSDPLALYTNTVADFDSVNFGLAAALACHRNVVSISASPPFRLGRPNTYEITYCNNGTSPSPGTYITVRLDSVLVLNSASLPYTSLPNNVFRFDIGTLDFQDCGSFSMVATPDPEKTTLFQTVCLQARIYPDTSCATPDYLGAFIEAGVQCLGDSVLFSLKNAGKGNMDVAHSYRIIENDTLILQQYFQLNANQTFTKTMGTKPGRTYRIIAEQPANLPAFYGDNFSTAALENCERLNSNFSTGYYNQFPNNNMPSRSIICNEITGAYDPNDKVAEPKGYSDPHYIEANTSIDYQVNFQNTGNDTAFRVVIIDTISSKLDINSIQPGASSHPYRFDRVDSSVIRFSFDNILLPDSNRNEPASHGFVQFRIQQKPNNPDGTKLYNKADIYFDYNLPVTTNETYHTVGRDFIAVNLVTQVIHKKFTIKSVSVFPNPFRNKAQIILDGDPLQDPVLQLMGPEGRLIKTIPAAGVNMFEVYGADLTPGMYLFNVLEKNISVVSGKLVVF